MVERSPSGLYTSVFSVLYYCTYIILNWPPSHFTHISVMLPAKTPDRAFRARDARAQCTGWSWSSCRNFQIKKIRVKIDQSQRNPWEERHPDLTLVCAASILSVYQGESSFMRFDRSLSSHACAHGLASSPQNVAGLARLTGIGASARSGYYVSLWLEWHFSPCRPSRANRAPNASQTRVGAKPRLDLPKKWTGVRGFFFNQKKSGKMLIGPTPAQWHRGNRNLTFLLGWIRLNGVQGVNSFTAPINRRFH